MLARALYSRRPRPPGANSNGFTLIEVIIAMSIFAILAMLSYAGLRSVMDSKFSTETQLARLEQVQMAMHTLSNDLQQIAPRDAVDSLGGKLYKASTQNSEFIFEFTRSGWRNPANTPRSTLQRVAYQLDEDKLVRIYWPYVDRADETTRIERVLIENVDSLSLRFMNDKTEWVNDWPEAAILSSGSPTPIPVAIEASLKLNDWGEIKRLLKVAP